MGTEFARTQEVLVDEIDRLRRKCGEWDGTAFLDNKFRETFKKDWAEPDSHPANSSLDDVAGGIDNPPKKPDELIREADSV